MADTASPDFCLSFDPSASHDCFRDKYSCWGRFIGDSDFKFAIPDEGSNLLLVHWLLPFLRVDSVYNNILFRWFSEHMLHSEKFFSASDLHDHG